MRELVESAEAALAVLVEAAEERDRLRALAKAAKSIAAAPDYDEEAIRDALWALVDAAYSAVPVATEEEP